MQAQIRTDDRVILRGVHRPAADRTLALVIGHGFTLNVNSRDSRRLIAALAAHAGVVALSFRGHGRSGGTCSVGDVEVLDLAAGVRFARQAGYARVATVGFSMGAAVALRHAGLGHAGLRHAGLGHAGLGHADLGLEHAGLGSRTDAQPDAVVAVSGPARWWSRESRPMRTVHWLLEQPHGRLVARLLGVRLGARWVTVPASPVEVVDRIAPTPLLLVHGDADHYFAVQHARQLHRASAGHAELWIEPGMGHGESGTSDELAGRIARWARTAVAAQVAA